MGPNGNQQGGHFFVNLNTGARVTRHVWTELPMPTHVIERVNNMGRLQGMPLTLTFGDRHANEIPDDLDEIVAKAEEHDDDTYQYKDEDNIPLMEQTDSDESDVFQP